KPAVGVWRVTFNKQVPGWLGKAGDAVLGVLDNIDFLGIIDPVPTNGPIGSEFIFNDSELGGKITSKTITEGVAGTQEVWELFSTATDGTFRLALNGRETTDLKFDASAQEI